MTNPADITGGEQPRLSRRGFVRASGGVVAASVAGPAMAAGFAGDAGSRPKAGRRGAVVVVFLRGGADGLSMVPPYGDPYYRRRRPTLGFGAPGSRGGCLALPGERRFGLAPALAPLLPAFAAGELAIVHAAGMPGGARSHFEAQRSLESGEASGAGVNGGWLGRWLASAAPDGRGSSVRAVGIGYQAPFVLAGAPEVVARPAGAPLPGEGALTAALREAAPMLRADAGLAAVAIDHGNWDHHAAQGPVDGAMAASMADLARGLAGFRDAAGRSGVDATVVVMSEFGRAIDENPAGGAEHGLGGVMMVMGAWVRGGRVHADWPGLSDEHGALAVTTDVRDVLAEVLAASLPGGPSAGCAGMFPGHSATPIRIIRGA